MVRCKGVCHVSRPSMVRCKGVCHVSRPSMVRCKGVCHVSRPSMVRCKGVCHEVASLNTLKRCVMTVLRSFTSLSWLRHMHYMSRP